MQYKKLDLLCLAILAGVLVGCGQNETKSVEVGSSTPGFIEMAGDTSQEGFTQVENAEKPPLPSDYKPGEPILFIDSSAFDSDLSAILEYGVDNLEVETSFSLNAIPERMERWLSEIKNNGGKIQAKKIVVNVAGTRSFLGIVFDLALVVVDKMQDAATYGPAESYNAMLYYDDAKMVQKVVFNRRATT